jgi:hypothetical protein
MPRYAFSAQSYLEDAAGFRRRYQATGNRQVLGAYRAALNMARYAQPAARLP